MTGDSAQPPVMTGALPPGDETKQAVTPTDPTDSPQEDGVKDVPATATKTAEPVVNGSDKTISEKDDAASTEVAPGAMVDEKKDADMKDVASVEAGGSSEQKDVDMKDAAPASTTAPASTATDASTTSGAVSATDGGKATGAKRKAEKTGANGTAANKEPAEKKHKGLAGKVATKAKEVVEEVKEKATPARKNSKKGKKEPAPVGRTERKTRSQGHAE